jgi:hypothetical protein
MQRVARFAEEHHAVFRSIDAFRHGISRNELSHARRTGEVVRLFRGVYRFAGAPLTWEARQLAACWAAGPRGFASHRAAGAIHGVPGGSRRLVVVTCPRWRRTHRDGIVVHETSQWSSADLVTVDGIPVASPPLMLLQLASSLPYATLEAAFENVLRRRLTTIDEIDDLLRRYARRGRPGVRRLRALVRSRQPGAVPTASERETYMLQAVRASGLPEPVRQYRVVHEGIELARVDLAYPDARIALEYDSDEFHTGRVATSRDSERRHRLIAAGWLPITAVGSDLRSGGELFCCAIRAALSVARSTVALR